MNSFFFYFIRIFIYRGPMGFRGDSGPSGPVGKAGQPVRFWTKP